MITAVRQFFIRYWRLGALIIGVIIISTLLYGRFLGSLPGGVSRQEVANLATYSSFHGIIDNPLHAPLKLVAWALWHIPFHNAAMLRAPYAFFAILSLVAFAYILKRWYGTRMAVLGVILFGTSSWMLHVGRVALFDISFLWASVTLLALHLLFHAHSDKLIIRFVWLVGMLSLLFVPGIVWLIILNLVLQRDDLLDSWDEITTVWEKITQPFLLCLVLGVIGFLIYRHPHLGLEWLGAPANWTDWQGILKRLANAGAYFIVRGPHQPAIWLGRLPILDAFGTIMLIAGIVFYGRHIRSFRTILIASVFALDAILVAILPAIGFSVLVPIVYAVIVGGIAYLLHQWLKVFPRNPLARGVGIALVAILVCASSAYNLRSYFVAWPHNNETRAEFTAVLPGTK